VYVSNQTGKTFNFAARRCGQQELKQRKKRTSYSEDEVDALALEAEEGRADRRNVQGERQRREEP
jgi:hypothetical protein